MGNAQSGASESFAEGLLEYPHYTRPQEFEGVPIPEVLLSGNHARIAAWRQAEAERLTAERRPDLLAGRGRKHGQD
jgi:tRNA (guanine37-N1)-methyltransferase